MPYVKSKPHNLYFKFKSKLYHNPTSNNLVGVDSYPKFYMKPTELLIALYWSPDSNSLDRGYEKDHELNFYVKNVHDLDDNGVEGEFWKMASKTPYGYTTIESYQEYVRETYNEVYQVKLESQWRALTDEGKITAATTTELAYSELINHHTISEARRFTRDEFYVPACAVEGLPKI